MKKIVIDEIRSHTNNDPYPYVKHFEREEMPILPTTGDMPVDATVTYEILSAWTFIDGNGREVNLCMPEAVRKVLGLPVGAVARLTEKLSVMEERDFNLSMSHNKLERELKRISDLKWYHRLIAVFFGLGVER